MNAESVNTKKLAAEKAVGYVESDMVVGLGTGTTAYWAIQAIGERIQREGLKIRAIATSSRSEEQAISLGIPMLSFAEFDQIDITIDGADEADEQLNLIKGGGGALLREKIVASNTRKEIIVVDETKLVKHLGKFGVPVEVAVFGWEKTFGKLQALGCVPRLRMAETIPYKTDNNNYIADCAFGLIDDPLFIHDSINKIVGVVENGLFVGLAHLLITGFPNGDIQITGRDGNG